MPGTTPGSGRSTNPKGDAMPDESAALIWCFCGRFEGHSHAWDARHCPAAGPVAGQHAARAHITAAEVDAEIRAAWKRGYDEGLYTGMQP